MPAEWEEDFWDQEQQLCNGDGKQKSNGVTLRPPLYNAEDYIAALKLLFSSHCHPNPHTQMQNKVKNSVLIEHSSSAALTSGSPQSSATSSSTSSKGRHERESPITPPEMSMRKFLNGSELLFKLEADLRHAYPTFVQEFVSVHCEGVLHTLEALKLIQTALDEVNALREQRKLFMDEQKCLQCLRLCLRNIEAVSKLSNYPGGLYPIAAAMVSTVTTTRIIALEILTCICSEGGAEGHFKVSEAISTLRLRLGEPIRCKLLIGAISSAAPGAFQAMGIRFLTAWVASAVSPRHKVHIQCELEEAGFSPSALRKGADLGGARESRQVQAELDGWDRVAIDVDTLTRQNSQLRNSVATLQQELATLKDKLKRMDPHPPKSEEIRRRTPKPKRIEELATTPADSEEEAEQIHQILEDLNNIVNSELNLANNQPHSASVPTRSRSTNKGSALESDIVPVHLAKSPPKKGVKHGPMSPLEVKTRPWPGSSASDDDDESDLVQTPSPKLNHKEGGSNSEVKNVRKVVEALEKTNPKLYFKHGSSKVSKTVADKDYQLLNFHKQNHMASRFVNFKSSKLYSSSPDNSCTGDGVANTQTPQLSPNFDQSESGKRSGDGGKRLRRSESLHTSLASIPSSTSSGHIRPMSPIAAKGGRINSTQGQTKSKGHRLVLDKWKSVDDLDMDDNFTLRWKYPNAELQKVEMKAFQEKSKGKAGKGEGRIMELFNDYRQSRFSKNSADAVSRGSNSSPVSRGSQQPNSIFSIGKYSKKSSQSVPAVNSKNQRDFLNQNGDKESNLKMFSLPPIFVSQGIDLMNHRICDLPSGLY